MTTTDPIADLLTRIRNAQMRGLAKTNVIGSKLNDRILHVLREEGFIDSFADVEQEGPSRRVSVKLKYFHGTPVVREVRRVSKPGRRVYASVGKLPSVYNGLGIAVVSTPRGVMTDHKARQENVGGEVICTVF